MGRAMSKRAGETVWDRVRAEDKEKQSLREEAGGRLRYGAEPFDWHHFAGFRSPQCSKSIRAKS